MSSYLRTRSSRSTELTSCNGKKERTRYFYSAYGLGIQSALALPELTGAEAGCDLLIRLATRGSAPPEQAEGASYLRWDRDRDEITYCLNDFVLARIERGQRITIRPAPHADERLVQLFTIGSLLPLALYQRGLFVLHGSSVEVDGGAIVFLGKSGLGKSSLAAALHERGHRIVADDVAAIRTDVGPPVVFPAFPQVKIHDDVAGCLGYSRDALLLLHSLHEKRGYRAKQSLLDGPLPLRCIYVLTPDVTLAVESLRPQEAMIELTRHATCRGLLQLHGGVSHFSQAAHVARIIPTYRLKRSADLSSLPALAQRVEEHVAGDVTGLNNLPL